MEMRVLRHEVRKALESQREHVQITIPDKPPKNWPWTDWDQDQDKDADEYLQWIKDQRESLSDAIDSAEQLQEYR